MKFFRKHYYQRIYAVSNKRLNGKFQIRFKYIMLTVNLFAPNKHPVQEPRWASNFALTKFKVFSAEI